MECLKPLKSDSVLRQKKSYFGVTRPTLKLGPTLDFSFFSIKKGGGGHNKIMQIEAVLLQNWELS